MSNEIAVVKSISGEGAKAINNLGETRELHVGDIVYSGEKIVTDDANSKITIATTNGKEATLIGKDSLNLDQNLVKDGSTHQILLSERATACFLFSDDSKFLAFSEWTADKVQIVKILRLADMSIKTVGKPKIVVEFLSFDDGVLEILDSPIFMPKNYTLDIRSLFDDKI